MSHENALQMAAEEAMKKCYFPPHLVKKFGLHRWAKDHGYIKKDEIIKIIKIIGKDFNKTLKDGLLADAHPYARYGLKVLSLIEEEINNIDLKKDD